MSKTGAGLAQWATDIIAGGNHVYWYGTYCNKCTSSLLTGKTKQYPDAYSDKRQATYKKHIEQGKIATDCVGLIKGYYWEQDGVVQYRRNGLPDKGASGMYKATTIKGDIATMPEIPGALVWTSSQGHVGVYVGGGYVVEARGFFYGVQRNKLTSRSFAHWGLCPYIEYTAAEIEQAKAAAGTATATGNASTTGSTSTTGSASTTGSTSSNTTGTAAETQTIKKGSTGDAAREMQTLLIKAGCTLPRYGVDGKCGSETVAALKAFQTANGLTADGICGALTWAKLRAVTSSTSSTSNTDNTSSTTTTTMTKRPTIKKGSTGDAVREMQTLLVKAGCTLPRYGIDGKCGAETVAAIKAFQTANSLTPDGICGALTWAKLDKA